MRAELRGAIIWKLLGSKLIFFCLFFGSSCSLQKHPVELQQSWNEEIEPADSLFKNFHGLITKQNAAVLEGEFINIVVVDFDEELSNSSFRKIKNEYSERPELISENDSSLPLPNRIWLETITINDSLEQRIMMYAYPSPVRGIQLTRAYYYRPSRDAYVGKLVSSIARNGLPEYIFTDLSADNIDFLGRNVQLGELCEWKNANSIECAGRGRIKWSIHPTAEEAQKALDIQMDYARSYNFSILIEEEKVPVVFEGVPVTATKLVFKLRAMNFLTTDKNAMIVYYLTAKVRGRHVHAVLSYHKGEAAPGSLPSLLQNFMELQ